MSPEFLSVEFPWSVARNAGVNLALKKPWLVGSNHHFLRFDFYPLSSPSHPGRHLAYFDLPLGGLGGPNLWATLSGKVLIVSDAIRSHAVGAVWFGSLPFAGYCRLTVSLWSTAGTGQSTGRSDRECSRKTCQTNAATAPSVTV